MKPNVCSSQFFFYPRISVGKIIETKKKAFILYTKKRKKINNKTKQG